MPHFVKVLAINVALVAVLAAAYFVLSPRPNDHSAQAEASSTNEEPAIKSEPVFQVIDPYELTKNPFQMKDEIGILDTGHMPLIFESGVVRGKSGMRSLRFKHMIADRVAIYSVLVGTYSFEGDEADELAVELPDNNPPSTSRAWLVKVEGTSDAVNGFGATIPIATVEFIRYAELPSPDPPVPAAIPTPVQPILSPGIQQAPETGDAVPRDQAGHTETLPPAAAPPAGVTSTQRGTQAPAPIERRNPD